MKSVTRLLRVIAGVGVFLALILTGWVLIPSYWANWQLQRYINQMPGSATGGASSADGVRARVINKASSLGLPVRSEDVHVTPSGGIVRLDVLYVVHVSVAGYAVDLHFRPAAEIHSSGASL